MSYAGVTIGALLTVELIILGALAFWLSLLLNSGDLPAQLIEATNEITPTLRPFLEQTPPDQAGIAYWLERIGRATSVSLPLSFDATDEMLVIGSDSQLLAAWPADLLPDSQIGQRLETDAIPGVAGPLQAALAGETDPQQLYRLATPADMVIFAVPVWDVAHEQVLGVLVAMTPRPTLNSVLGELASVLGVSLLLFTLVATLAGTVYGSWAARGPVRRLERLAEAIQAWSQGDFSVAVDDPAGDELGVLAQRLNEMARQLEQLLETRRVLAVVEERNRLARDLHDSAKQQAFAVAAQISGVRSLWQQDPEKAAAHLEASERLIYELRQELASLVQELRPAALEGKGLAAAVRHYANDWSQQTAIGSEVRVRGERTLPLGVEQSLYRILQEALANVARHSQAMRIEIALIYTKDEISLVVHDDGLGFELSRSGSGFGLRSMRERSEALGGKLVVRSGPDHGTTITCNLPVLITGES